MILHGLTIGYGFGQYRGLQRSYKRVGLQPAQLHPCTHARTMIPRAPPLSNGECRLLGQFPNTLALAAREHVRLCPRQTVRRFHGLTTKRVTCPTRMPGVGEGARQQSCASIFRSNARGFQRCLQDVGGQVQARASQGEQPCEGEGQEVYNNIWVVPTPFGHFLIPWCSQVFFNP